MLDELIGFGVVKLDEARIREAPEANLVFLHVREVLFARDSDGDHLTALFGDADGEDLHARAGLLKHAKIFVDIGGVGKDSGRAGNISEDDFGRGDGLRGREIVHERRAEERLGRVLFYFCGVSLVDGLLGVAARFGFVGLRADHARSQQRGERCRQYHPRFQYRRSIHMVPL